MWKFVHPTGERVIRVNRTRVFCLCVEWNWRANQSKDSHSRTVKFHRRSSRLLTRYQIIIMLARSGRHQKVWIDSFDSFIRKTYLRIFFSAWIPYTTYRLIKYEKTEWKIRECEWMNHPPKNYTRPKRRLKDRWVNENKFVSSRQNNGETKVVIDIYFSLIVDNNLKL